MSENKYSVLIIDDSSDDRYLLKRKLNKISIVDHIFEANNGQTALDLFSNYQKNRSEHPEDFPPVIIFLDVNMPIVNGLEFLDAFSKIREVHNELKSSLIMMFTSSDSPEDQEKAFTYDFVKAYLTKFDASPQTIEEKIQEVIKQ